MISTVPVCETNISSPHGENHIPLFPLPQTDFTFLVQVGKTDPFIEGPELPVIDIASPWAMRRLASHGRRTGSSHGTAQRQVCPGLVASFIGSEMFLEAEAIAQAVLKLLSRQDRGIVLDGKNPSSTGRSRQRASAEVFQGGHCRLLAVGDLRRLKGQNRLGHIEAGIGQRLDRPRSPPSAGR